MTYPEFRSWLGYHLAAFVGLGTWLGRIPEVSRDGFEPDRRAVLRHWAETLRETELGDAKAATDLLHSGEEAEPKGYDRHPAAVRAIARRLARHRAERERGPGSVEGQKTVKCRACLDQGFRVCWHPWSMQAAHPDRIRAAEAARARGERGPRVLGDEGTLHRVAVPCDCEAGAAAAKEQKVRYDPMLWKEVLHISDHREQQDLIAWMANRHLHARVFA